MGTNSGVTNQEKITFLKSLMDQNTSRLKIHTQIE